MAPTILSLPGNIPSERLNVIKTLWFQWHVRQVPHEKTAERKEWTRVWKIIASLEGLERLRVEILPSVFWEHEWPIEEKRLLEDTRYVTRPTSFMLELAWIQGDVPLQLPCTVTRIPKSA